jgi:hypothetical protein
LALKNQACSATLKTSKASQHRLPRVKSCGCRVDSQFVGARMDAGNRHRGILAVGPASPAARHPRYRRPRCQERRLTRLWQMADYAPLTAQYGTEEPAVQLHSPRSLSAGSSVPPGRCRGPKRGSMASSLYGA